MCPLNRGRFNDILIGAWSFDTGGHTDGKAYVYSGADYALLTSVTGSGNEKLGASVAGLGDVTGDSVPDFIVGADGNARAGAQSGRAIIFSGADFAVVYDFSGFETFERFGVSLRPAGDINNDGTLDIAIADQPDSTLPLGAVFASHLYIFSGVDGAPLMVIPNTLVHLAVERSLASAIGDINSDGFDDIAVAVKAETSLGGVVNLYSGKDGLLLFSLSPPTADKYFGVDVFGGEDVNGDGISDIIVSAPALDSTIVDTGHAYVFLGGDPDNDFIPTLCGDN